MNMRNILRNSATVGLAVSASVWAAPRTAHAYDWDTHSGLVRNAISTMAKVAAAQRPPPGLKQDEYFIQMQQAVQRLSLLDTGLGTVLPVCTASTAQLDNTDFTQSANLRIKEFAHCTTGSGLTGCSVTKIDPSDSRCPGADAVVGSILGWHAGNVDNHLADVTLWVRPSSIILGGPAKKYLQDALDLGIGAIAVPIICLAKLIFSGDLCDPSHEEDAVRAADPLPYLEGWIPGIGSIQSSQFTGLWHFIDVDSITNDYNDRRGMLYTEAGPRLHGLPPVPGAIDVALAVVSGLSGLSLRAGESDGVKHFGKYDRVQRSTPRWQSPTLGQLEFSPLDHLAQYGWDLFLSKPTTAEGLGWPLHALGDAAEPHHVAGTTGWGHRPFEDSVNNQFDNILSPDDTDQQARILQASEDWYGVLCGDISAPCTQVSIEALVSALALRTRQIVSDDGDSVYRDDLSTRYAIGQGVDALGDAVGVGDPGLQQVATSQYDSSTDLMRSLLEQSAGAMIAFLTAAAQHAEPAAEVPGTCPPGEVYLGQLSIRPESCGTAPCGPPPIVGNCPVGACCLGSPTGPCAGPDCVNPLSGSGSGSGSDPGGVCANRGDPCQPSTGCCDSHDACSQQGVCVEVPR